MTILVKPFADAPMQFETVFLVTTIVLAVITIVLVAATIWVA
jgi:hypothetical protein